MLRVEECRRSGSLATCLIMLCFGLACATGYHPVLSAEPNPFRGIQSFAVQPLEYIDLVVDEVSEEEFLARKKEEAEKWTTIKANIKSDYEEAFRNGLEQAGLLADPGAEYVLRAYTSKIDTGYYRIPAWNAVSRVNIHFQVTRADGEVLDEIHLYQGVAFDIIAAPTVNGRLRRSAKMAGHNAARYLEGRVK